MVRLSRVPQLQVEKPLQLFRGPPLTDLGIRQQHINGAPTGARCGEDAGNTDPTLVKLPDKWKRERGTWATPVPWDQTSDIW